MAVNYLYIDDDSSDRANGTVQGFKKGDIIEVSLSQPESSWEQQIQFLESKQNEDLLDGLIIDLRLDDYANTKSGLKASYRGTSFAQEIRTRQKEGSIKEFPIVLFSGNDKVTQSLENSGQDLFDICIEKESITSDSIYETTFIPQLYGLAEGYRTIKESAGDLLKILNTETNQIDDRFIAELSNLAHKPTHIIARFIVCELLTKQGILVDELTLAARLGVDINSSEKDWKSILASLDFAFYKGVFGKGWRRWWMPLIELWWRETIQSTTYLRSTPAVNRVELIKRGLGLQDVMAARRIDKADSDEFWVVCKGLKLPLDPIDGLMIDGQENLYPWQDAEYISIEAALKRKNIQSWNKVAKLEENRLLDLEKQFRKTR